MTAALEGSEWSAACLDRTLLPGKTRNPFYRMLGGSQGRSGRAENFVPTGIQSRTVQPVAQSVQRLSYPAHHLYRYPICIKGTHKKRMNTDSVKETQIASEETLRLWPTVTKEFSSNNSPRIWCIIPWTPISQSYDVEACRNKHNTSNYTWGMEWQLRLPNEFTFH